MAGRLRIVLVEPREAGNVGAAARAMKNFGFDELVLVGQLPALQPVAEWWASGAEDLVLGARRVETLREAVADCAIVYATTSARGRDLDRVHRPHQVADVRRRMGDGQTLALVFGREDRGLTSEETDLCGRIAVIPTNPQFTTMNLAQSVSTFCYELQRDVSTAVPDVPLAPHALVDRLHERAAALLLDAGFLDSQNPEHIYGEFRALAARAELTPREAELLLAAVRQLEWKMKNRE